MNAGREVTRDFFERVAPLRAVGAQG